MHAKLERFSQIVRRRVYAIVAVCMCGVIAAPFVPLMIHPSYRATARVLVVNEATKATEDASSDLPAIAQSSAVLERVRSRLKVEDDLETFRKHVKAKASAHSSIMEITYRDRDDRRAGTIANAIADETVVYYREIATGRYDDVTRQLSGTIVQLRAQINNVNGELQRLSADNPYANSDRASEDLTTHIGELRTVRDQAYADLLSDRAADAALAGQGPRIAGIVEREVLASDPVYSAIEKQLATDEAMLAVQSATYTDANPAVASLRARLDLERTQLRKAAAAALQSRKGSSVTYASNVLEQRKAAGKAAGDEARVQALDGQIAEAQRHLRETFGPGASVQVLRAERAAAQQQYLEVTQRLSSARADATQAASLGTLVVVDRAVADTAMWKTLLGLLPVLYALFICGLAIAAAYALENIDRRFRDARELEEFYGRPVFEIGRS